MRTLWTITGLLLICLAPPLLRTDEPRKEDPKKEDPKKEVVVIAPRVERP